MVREHVGSSAEEAQIRLVGRREIRDGDSFEGVRDAYRCILPASESPDGVQPEGRRRSSTRPLGTTARLVDVEHGAGVEGLCLEQFELQRFGQVAEHRQAAAERDGMNDEDVFVD